MTTPFESPAPPPPGLAPVRPGRKLGPIADRVGSSHRAWLEPTRCSYITSGRTLSDLSEHVLLAKSKLSELLRGVGHYPRWEVVHRLSIELGIPNWPLYRLWRQGALDIGKSKEWIDRSSENTGAVPPGDQPLEHSGLRFMMEDDYRCYAAAFLAAGPCDDAIEDTFAILWLSWEDALASPDIRRYAWNILRATVLAKATYRDNLPELENAAFDTVAMYTHRSETGRITQLTESLELYKAISKLPPAQLDVMVLRYLCGASEERTSHLLGVPLAVVRSDERHAHRFLHSAITLPPETEGPVT
ncbi:DNA-directed RNA polymerase specialized sigma subunit, sigma24 family [Streptomyces misionensis]|uniref:DNA-directed RNA polymerase specialized sigma subunit, sigma24 family n=1 Tax=Streptomyces misionensis TaxID=67331 RepID=A0A1H4IES3_9ACTN|nr:sigma-70 family RNA polymerase sigma factor [Streptomyces misionensis]SEB32166.1 DNA-directed RNA polymerase specialized sigma subunit, sigma24 family [Streptomyces misionensis]